MATRKAALVTGGAIRVGKAMCLALAEHGFDIAIHYNSSAGDAVETADEIARRHGVACEVFQANLLEIEQLSGLVANVVERFPRLELLVNNASHYARGKIGETSADLFDEMFALHLRAPFILAQTFANSCERGQIINILDYKIFSNQSSHAAYLLSKKALAEFTKMAALEFAPGIRVNGVAPGFVLPNENRSGEVEAWRQAKYVPLEQPGQPEFVAQAVVHLVANSFINGQIITVDGGESLR